MSGAHRDIKGRNMGLSADQIRTSLDMLAAGEPAFAAAIARIGYPEPRIRARGYDTLLRTIVGQQVSVQAANAVWNKLEAALGAGCSPRISIRCGVAGFRVRSKAMRAALPS
jgi:3-methyladenine DNA glycosylase/8-oxoguanine DNA glycosylase